MSQIKRTIEKDLNYTTLYADGAIFRLEGDTPRLIFYQKEVEPSDDRMTMEAEKETIRLKLEVRLSHASIRRLMELVQPLYELRESAIKMTQATSGDKKTINTWVKLQRKLSSLFQDSEWFQPLNRNSLALKEIEEQVNELAGRSQKASVKENE